MFVVGCSLNLKEEDTTRPIIMVDLIKNQGDLRTDPSQDGGMMTNAPTLANFRQEWVSTTKGAQDLIFWANI